MSNSPDPSNMLQKVPRANKCYTVSCLVVLFVILCIWFFYVPSTDQPSGLVGVHTYTNIPIVPSFQPAGPNETLGAHDQTHMCANLSTVSIKPIEVIMDSHWASKLLDTLRKMNFQDKNSINTDLTMDSQLRTSLHKQVTIVVSDIKYVLSLLNWLVAALVRTSPPIENVIVISFDKALQALMDKKGIRSVYVNPGTITCGQFQSKTSRVWVARCAIYRLLNHWGYDVVAYDIDAIVLKNLQNILDTYPASDVVASSGFYPFKFGAKWGQTLCMGVVLFRSTRKTGE